MSPLPLSIRVAAGLAAIALERARKLPQDVSEWPMTMVSQALQVSMRLQQRITELAIKGDEALARLREPDDDPPWAVFDEDFSRPSRPRPGADDEVDGYGVGVPGFGVTGFGARPGEDRPAEAARPTGSVASPQAGATPDAAGPAAKPAAATAETADTPVRNGGHAGGRGGPAACPNYDELSLASVRGRLRGFTVDELEELLRYERGHHDRPEFVRMLTNRIATVSER
jgi:hypothetical protein